MAPVTQSASFPGHVFAALSGAAFLHKHLTNDASNPTRPNGRAPHETRTPFLNTSSLTHSSGSAVARIGDTAVVVGVRTEILAEGDIADFENEESTRGVTPEHELESRLRSRRIIRQYGLLVPNVEFSTGCTKNNIPGNAPTSKAQAVAWRLRETLIELDLIDITQLEIRGQSRAQVLDGVDAVSVSDSDSSDAMSTDAADTHDFTGGSRILGYFVLYIDVTVLSYDGSALSTMIPAILASLQTARLPRPYYSEDLETILCSPLSSESKALRPGRRPIPTTFAVFEPSREKGLASEEQSWLLADPDAWEEERCLEHLTIVVDRQDSGEGVRILQLSKSGGTILGRMQLKEAVDLAAKRWFEWNALLDGLD